MCSHPEVKQQEFQEPGQRTFCRTWRCQVCYHSVRPVQYGCVKCKETFPDIWTHIKVKHPILARADELEVLLDERITTEYRMAKRAGGDGLYCACRKGEQHCFPVKCVGCHNVLTLPSCLVEHTNWALCFKCIREDRGDPPEEKDGVGGLEQRRRLGKLCWEQLPEVVGWCGECGDSYWGIREFNYVADNFGVCMWCSPE